MLLRSAVVPGQPEPFTSYTYLHLPVRLCVRALLMSGQADTHMFHVDFSVQAA